MKLTSRNQDGIHIISLVGSFIHLEVKNFRQQLSEIITQHSAHVIIDLGQLSFIDAQALSTFLSARKLAQQQGGEVVLLNPTPKVRALLELTRLQHTFFIYGDEKAAIAQLLQQKTNSYDMA